MDDVGSTFHTDGSIVYSNGTLVSPEGAIFFNNGTIKFSDGAVLHRDLKIIRTDGTEVQGQLYDADAIDVIDDGVTRSNDGGSVKKNGDGTTATKVASSGEVEGEVAVENEDGASTTGEIDVEPFSEDQLPGEVDVENGTWKEELNEADLPEKFEIVGTLDVDKIINLWTAKRCDDEGSGAGNCSLLGHLKNSTLLLQLVETLAAKDDKSTNTWSDIVQIMKVEGMIPDANSYVATILSQDMDQQASGEGGQLSSGVHCDHRELSCRNGLACYHKTRHCDLKADCSDFSDEDSCSCRDRLVGNKLCDGYADCPGAEDEIGCGCNEDQFRCRTSGQGRRSVVECVAAGRVCDGVDDCKDGSDEEDCLVLAPREGFTMLANTDSKGFLHAKVPQGEAGGYVLVGFTEEDSKREEMLNNLVQRVCADHLSLGQSYLVRQAKEDATVSDNFVV